MVSSINCYLINLNPICNDP